MTTRRRFRTLGAPFAALALAALLVSCMSRTTAEDPLPGALQRSAVVADEHGGLGVHASVLLPLSEAWTRHLAGEEAFQRPWREIAPGLPRELSFQPEAPGWSRLTVDLGPLPGGLQAEAEAERVRLAWHETFAELRAAVERGDLPY